GGGVFSEGVADFGSNYPPARVTLTNVTVAGNSATSGAGVYNHSASALALANTVVADNTRPQVTNDEGGASAFHPGYAATRTVQGPNLVEGGLQGFPDVLSVDPKLGDLQDNGGPTQTMALFLGSPAINAGDNTLIPDGITTDQRGSGFE